MSTVPENELPNNSQNRRNAPTVVVIIAICAKGHQFWCETIDLPQRHAELSREYSLWLFSLHVFVSLWWFYDLELADIQ